MYIRAAASNSSTATSTLSQGVREPPNPITIVFRSDLLNRKMNTLLNPKKNYATQASFRAELCSSDLYGDIKNFCLRRLYHESRHARTETEATGKGSGGVGK
jgi:hypothetical protein